MYSKYLCYEDGCSPADATEIWTRSACAAAAHYVEHNAYGEGDYEIWVRCDNPERTTAFRLYVVEVTVKATFRARPATRRKPRD